MFRSRFAVVAATVALVLVGCGGSDDPGTTKKKPDLSNLSATELLDRTKASFKSEDAVAINGEGTDEGSTIGIDMSYVGKDAEGAITIDGDELKLLAVDGKSYFKAGDSFWRSMGGAEADQIIALINGRWILANDDPDFQELVSFADRTAFADELLKPEGTPKLGDPKTVAGVECLAIDDEGDVLYVAKDDGRPIQITSAEEEGSFNFTYEDSKAPTAPAKSEVVDISRLAG